MADVTLDISNFREHYPKFAEEKVSDAEVEDAWHFACSMCGSTDKDSRLPYMPAAEPPVYDRKIALYLIMCHVLTIGMWGAGQAGAVQSASQGSVSTSFQLLQGKTTSESWWLQTPAERVTGR